MALITVIKTDLAESTSCVMRKTFIYFCKSAVNTFSRNFFKENFLELYMALSKDNVATVRMEFAKSLLTIKPYFDGDPIVNNDLMSLLNLLSTDVDRDVMEAAEHCDCELLYMRKSIKELEKQYKAADM